MGLSTEEIEEFLDWCFTEDPDFDPPAKPGTLRDRIEDTGGFGLCDCVCKELMKFAVKRGHQVCLFWIEMPHRAYPTGEEWNDDAFIAEHCLVRVDGTVVDFTAKQFDTDYHAYPVPYTW